jgi:glycerophosphoryl diester phosphodiesterase
MPPLVIAHRGDSSRALENSIESIRLALSIPVDMIEFDIRKSIDNQLFLMHDRQTGRTADQDIPMEGSRSKEIARIRLKNGEKVPTLEEILTLVSGRAALNIEIKSDESGALCAEELRKNGYDGPVLISSFLDKEVMVVRRINSAFSTAQIFQFFSPEEVDEYKAKGHRIISLSKSTVTEELLTACHEKGIQVLVWTVDEEEEIKKFIALGVDGIVSNRPALLKRLVESKVGRTSF